MASTKRSTSTSEKTPRVEPPMVLLQEVVDDLRYIEPTRARDRLIVTLNEAFLRIMRLEHAHQ